jgi:hypothetical protein
MAIDFLLHNSPHTITLNLIGTACRIWQIPFTPLIQSKIEKICLVMGLSLEKAVQDPLFIKLLNRESIEQSAELNQQLISGLIQNDSSHLEIRINARKKRRIFLKDMLVQDLLFPTYNAKVSKVDSYTAGALVNVEKETGLAATFKIYTERLDLDKLQFNFTHVETGYESLILLSSITYEGKQLYSLTKDTLVTSSYVVLRK